MSILAELDERQRRYEAIKAPVTDDEARELLSGFGDDECFGMPGACYISLRRLRRRQWRRIREMTHYWVRLLWLRLNEGRTIGS